MDREAKFALVVLIVALVVLLVLRIFTDASGASALGAAILGALAAYGFGEFRAWRERQRELRGLLTLLDDEIGRNEGQLRIFFTTPRWITDAPDYALQMRDWNDTRVRLSQLLSTESYSDIAKYYNNLSVINDFRLKGVDEEAYRRERVAGQLRLLLQQSETARQHIRDSGVADALAGAAPPLEGPQRPEDS